MFFSIRRISLFGALVLAMQSPGVGRAADAPPAGIVLVISDGTSQELITAARIYAAGVQGHLALESFPQTAIVRTYSRSDVVTDSAAAATAMARGIKADNTVIGMATRTSKTSPPSLLDLARKAGWSTGIVTDDSVTGATEAPFLLEDGNRNETPEIAAKTLAAIGPRADIVLGGGAQWFRDLSGTPGVAYKPGELPVVRVTQAKLVKSGVATFDEWPPFVDHVAKLSQTGDTRPVLGTFYPDVLPYYADGTRKLRVADLAEQAVHFLRARKRPFFLMVEAALPDKACHLGNAKRAIVEVLELDELIKRLRATLPPSTLLLVTTDHNNGGLAISGPPVPLATRGDALLGPNPITRAAGILSWATGPGFDQKNANLRTPAGPNAPAVMKTPADPDYVQPAAMKSNAVEHTGGDVWLLGEGPGSEAVHGYLDNTDIYRLIAAAIQSPRL
jgi:alkaline phosphatase